MFDAGEITTLVERFQRILLTMTTDPKRRLSSMEALSVRERAELDQWGGRAVLSQPYAGASVPGLFAMQVARTPDAVALVCGGRSLSYRGLDEASNRLAHVLVGRGAGPGRSVAVLFDRSAEAVVAIVAVLKSGAAYLPIDPGLPAARIEFMLADTAPVVAVTSGDLLDRFSGFAIPVLGRGGSGRGGSVGGGVGAA